MRVVLLLISFLYSGFFSYSQTQISGTVRDTSGNVIPAATIVLAARSGLILKYSVCNDKGVYELTFDSKLAGEGVMLIARSMRFRPDTMVVADNRSHVDFRLVADQQSHTLNEVVVRSNSPLIKTRGDTIRYNVDSLSRHQDRSILDVIKNLPGIEVLENGEIKFQGRAINRLYVDGENLTDGKYNSVTFNLSNDMVSAIEILQKHQPIKSLDGISPSLDPALNIVLKDKARSQFSGNGNLSAGTPGVYDLTANGMLFSKKVQSVTTQKFSNIGRDLRLEIEDHLSGKRELEVPPPVIGVNLVNPPLSASRYFVHEGILSDANLLIKLKPALDFRLNLNYAKERQLYDRSVIQDFYFPLDTVHVEEKATGISKESIYSAGISIIANQKKIYISNESKVDLRIIDNPLFLVSSSAGAVNEKYDSKRSLLSNDFKLIKPAGGRSLIELTSSFLLGELPQTKTIEPGQFAGIINGGAGYNELLQTVKMPVFSTNHQVIVRIPAKITQAYSFGYKTQSQALTSYLNKVDRGGITTAANDSFVNHLKWHKNSLYAESRFVFNAGKLAYELTFPVSYSSLRYQDASFNRQLNRLFFQPSVLVRFSPTKESQLQFSGVIDNSIGGVQNAFEGYIVKGYRSITSQSGLLPITNTKLLRISYEWNHVPDLLFFYSSLSYSYVNKNTMASQITTGDLTKVSNVALDNYATNLNLSARISKYLIGLNTNLALSGDLFINSSSQLQNGLLLRYRTNAFTVNGKLSTKFNEFLTGSYDGSLLTTVTKPFDLAIGTGFVRRFYTLSHRLNLTILPIRSIFILTAAEMFLNFYEHGNKNEIIFLDFVTGYRSPDKKLEFQVSLLNLFNKDRYTAVTAFGNAAFSTAYNLRPATQFVKMTYRF